MCYAYNKKWENRNNKRKIITEEIQLPNQERIRTLAEKENSKFLGILEAGTIKQAEMKEKNSVSDERESFSKPSSIVEI